MNIVIRFEDGTRFPYSLVTNTLDSIADALFTYERTAIERAADEISDFPSVAVDAALQRIDRYRDAVLQVEAARPGSLELVVAGTALGYWLLDKTLGETIKESWKYTDLHRRLKSFFQSGKKERAEAVADAASHPFRRRYYYRHEWVDRRVFVRHEISQDASQVTIHIIEEKRRKEIITYEELDRDEKS